MNLNWRDLTKGSVYTADPILFSPFQKIKNIIIMLCDYHDDEPGDWEVDLYYSEEWRTLDQSSVGYETGKIDEYHDEEELDKNIIYRLALKKLFNPDLRCYL